MNDLRNVIAHILEHQQHLEGANEAITQQYVVLPILRALGWDDTNLASMEVLPEHSVGTGSIDYALQVEGKNSLLIECKSWNDPLQRHEDQIARYAFNAGAPIAILTSGKIWCFYLSWVQGHPVNERIFCETDIENQETAISDLEKYLLKSNVASGEAERDAGIALEEKQRPDSSSESVPIRPTIPDNDVIDPKPIRSEISVAGKRTIDQVMDSLSPELRAFYKKTFREERLKLFYRAAAGVLNLIQKEEWKLNPPKFSKMLCGFWLTNKGVIGNIKRIVGILPGVGFPLLEIVDRDGKLVKKSLASVPPRLFVRITEEEAKQLESRDNRCEFHAISKHKTVDYIYYDIPEDMSTLRPVLEFAYKKHSGD